MKKVLFNVLMISAMVVLASCGSKSNSGEATAEESAAKVEFTDPAIVFDGGIDLSSYFSAERVTQPTIYKSSTYNYLSTTVKLKLTKVLNIEKDPNHVSGEVIFNINFCDKNGSKIASGYTFKRVDDDHLAEMKEGTILSLDITSDEHDVFESNMQEMLKKVERIEVGIRTQDIQFKEEK